MANVAIKSEKLSPFGGIFSIMEQFDSNLSSVIDSTLGMRCKLYGYQYSEIIRSLLCVYFCGGSCVEDVTTHLAGHLSLHPTLRTCNADTILRAINELSQEYISYTSDVGKSYDFNTADTLNILLLNCLLATGQLKEGEGYFERIEQKGLTVNRFRADCGSCSAEIVEEVGKHCKTFYIRANRSSSLYDDIFALRRWKKEEFNGIPE